MGGINPSFLHGHVTELPSGRYLSVTLQDRGGSEIVYNGATELMNSTVHLWKLDGAAASGSFALDRGKYPGFYAESAKRDLQVAELGGKLWGLWLDDRARLDMDTVKYNEHVFLGEVKAA
jgi:hypothetical protein